MQIVKTNRSTANALIPSTNKQKPKCQTLVFKLLSCLTVIWSHFTKVVCLSASNFSSVKKTQALTAIVLVSLYLLTGSQVTLTKWLFVEKFFLVKQNLKLFFLFWIKFKIIFTNSLYFCVYWKVKILCISICFPFLVQLLCTLQESIYFVNSYLKSH